MLRIMSAISSSARMPLSLARSVRLNQSASRSLSLCMSWNALWPFGVPMIVAQPLRSASAGRMTAPQTDGFQSPNSSQISPSKNRPRSASGLSAPNTRMRAPLSSSTHNSEAFFDAVIGSA